jgi:hypothetical protein
MKQLKNKFKDYYYNKELVNGIDENITSVFIVIDDIETSDNLLELYTFIDKIKCTEPNINTILLDPIVSYKESYGLSYELSDYEQSVYNKLFDNISMATNAIYYLKLEGDNSELSDIRSTLGILHAEYDTDKSNHKATFMYTSMYELPFD